MNPQVLQTAQTILSALIREADIGDLDVFIELYRHLHIDDALAAPDAIRKAWASLHANP